MSHRDIGETDVNPLLSDLNQNNSNEEHFVEDNEEKITLKFGEKIFYEYEG
jgi:hypothetical protein